MTTTTTTTNDGAPTPNATNTPAPGGWFVCVVTATAAASDGRILIGLQVVAGSPFPIGESWFTASAACKREMLAIALSALGRYQVTVSVASTDQYSELTELQMSRISI